jgi:hypothetical protein
LSDVKEDEEEEREEEEQHRAKSHSAQVSGGEGVPAPTARESQETDLLHAHAKERLQGLGEAKETCKREVAGEAKETGTERGSESRRHMQRGRREQRGIPPVSALLQNDDLILPFTRIMAVAGRLHNVLHPSP